MPGLRWRRNCEPHRIGTTTESDFRYRRSPRVCSTPRSGPHFCIADPASSSVHAVRRLDSLTSFCGNGRSLSGVLSANRPASACHESRHSCESYPCGRPLGSTGRRPGSGGMSRISSDGPPGVRIWSMRNGSVLRVGRSDTGSDCDIAAELARHWEADAFPKSSPSGV